MSLGLYLHIPYCFSKCRYCDFYSAPGQRGVPRAYVDALLRELSRFAPDAPLRPDSLYFGGGTPSLLDPADAARLIAAAQPLPGAEITLEANPETVTEDSLRAFREAGVNRISFGVQSARDSQLKTLGRPHTAKQARAAFAAARRAVICTACGTAGTGGFPRQITGSGPGTEAREPLSERSAARIFFLPVHRERLNISRNRLRMPCPVCFRKETLTSAVPKISAVP